MLKIQHEYNPLHLYCRLIEKGFNKRLSMAICRYYELVIYSGVTWFTVLAVQILTSVKRAS
jgi:hypothetical protein